MKFTCFEQVIEYMETYMNLEKNNALFSNRTYRTDRMTKIMAKLGNPQNCYKTIHAAGSKGKGSTCSFIARGLEENGFKTGLYLSPHLVDYRERFTINGCFAEEKDLVATGCELYEKLKDISFTSDMGAPIPTTFELFTAFAFLLFKNTGCEWAVIETGMGGRLDATNIIKPQASVLTPVELEHTEILGKTINLIAIEKSKIIKDNTPCFISYQTKDAYDVFEKEAQDKNSTFYSLEKEVTELKTETSADFQSLDVVFKDGYSASLKLKMLGRVQAENAALALLVLHKLNLTDRLDFKKIEANVLPGRMEKTAFARPLYIDGAHTPRSIKNTVDTFRSIFPDKNLGICIFGLLSGKKTEEISSIIMEGFNTIIVCRPGTYKKSNPAELYDYLLSIRKPCQTVLLIEDAKQALQYCINNTEKETPVLCCGSFYLGGEIKNESSQLF